MKTMKQDSVYNRVRFGYKSFEEYIVRDRVIVSTLDGLKPSYRLGIVTAYREAKDFQKVSTLAGCMLKVHPHSSDACESVLVRLTNMGILDGEGEFGLALLSGDDAPAAAGRYIESRLNKKYRELLDFLMKYVPIIQSESGEDVPAYIPTPIPLSLIDGSKTVAPGISASIPAFTMKSCLEAMMENNPMKLKPSSGLQILNPESLKDIWKKGKANVYYALDIYKDVIEGIEGVVIKGSADVFKPNLDTLEEWREAGFLFVNDITENQIPAIFIGKNKGVRQISVDDIYNAIKDNCVNREFVNIMTLTPDGVAHPTSLKYWLWACYNNFKSLIEKYKEDELSKLEFRKELYSNFDKIRDTIIKDIKKGLHRDAEEIAKELKLKVELIKEVENYSVNKFRSIDSKKELELIKKAMNEINSMKPKKIIQDLVNELNRNPKYVCRKPITYKKDFTVKFDEDSINVEDVEEDK